MRDSPPTVKSRPTSSSPSDMPRLRLWIRESSARHSPPSLPRSSQLRVIASGLFDSTFRRLRLLIFTGLVAGYLLILVLGFVVPPFGRVFADMKIALPWITGALVTASEAFVPFRGACWAAPPWILGLLTLCGVPAGGSPLLAAALLRYPWIGRVLRHAAASQITLGISRLLGSGRSLPDALSCLREATRSTFLREKMDQVLGDVLRGEPLAHALGRTGLLDPVSTGFIAEGEERGYLAQMLEGVSIEEARRVGRSLLVIRIAVGAAPFLIGAMILGSWMALWQPLLGLFHG